MALSVLFCVSLLFFQHIFRTCTGSCDPKFTADSSGSICYMFFSSTPMNMQDAQNYCNSLSPASNLPTFATKVEYDNFYSLAVAKDLLQVDMWVGISRLCGTGPGAASFKFINGQALTFDNWENGQPNNLYSYNDLNEEQTCVYMDSYYDLKFNDLQCGELNPFVCQYRDTGTTPTAISFTAPYCPIGDPNLQQCPYGWAVSSLRPELCYYFTSVQTGNWSKSLVTCRQLHPNASLPMIHGLNRLKIFSNLTNLCNRHNSMHIGLRYNASQSAFTWIVDGTNLTYPNWAASNPQSTPGTDCAYTDTSNPYLFQNDYCVSNTHKFITCQLFLAQPKNTSTTCSYVPTPGIQGICPNTKLTPDGRVWFAINLNNNKWDNGMQRCNRHRSYLARPMSPADITSLLSITNNQDFWIGAQTDSNSKTYWYDTDTSSANKRLLWAPGPGQFTETSSSCYYYDSAVQDFSSATCSSDIKFVVCEKPASLNCPLYQVSNGIVTICDGFLGYVKCDTGFYMQGSYIRVCDTNSSGDFWVTDPQQCYAYCNDLTVNNATITYSPSSAQPSNPAGSYDISVAANVACDRGVLVGNSTPICQADGSWSATPVCRSDCADIILANGNVTYTPDKSSGSTATFACNPNYQLITDNPTLTCQPTMTWDYDPPICQQFCDSQPCQNGATCQNTDSSYSCTCATGYYGTNCDQLNTCISGPIHTIISGRRKRSELDTLPDTVSNELQALNSDAAAAFNATLSQMATKLGCTGSIADCLINKTFDQLSQIAGSVDIPTVMKTNSVCKGSSVCMGGASNAVCICDAQYYGDDCGQRNCSGNALTDWGECYVPDCEASNNGQRNRTYIDTSFCDSPIIFKEDCQGDCIPPDPLSPVERTVATVTQSIGCTVMIGFICAVLILFAAFRIIHLERMLQMCQEISLIIAHITLIVTFKLTLDKTSCSIVGTILQLSFLSNFAFLTLEALQTYCVLQNVLSSGGFFTWKVNLLIGFGTPLGITTLTSAFLFRYIRSKYSCWLNMGHLVSYGTMIPILFCFFIATVMTEAATMGGDIKRFPLTSREKYLAAMISQKAFVIKLTFNVLSFTFGAWSMYAQKVALYGAVFGFNVTLGVIIFFAHTSGNERVIEFVKEKFLCMKQKHHEFKQKQQMKTTDEKLST